MTEEQELYISIGQDIKDSTESQMFGKPCFKINGKAFVCFFQNEMVFKLAGETHSEALSLDASHLFDPSGKKRPMKEWVQVAYDYKQDWNKFAKSAAEYVSGIKK
ncbi:MAG: hypothetical protein ABJN84_10685 [Flavobacteriaceae bacterium]